MSNERKKWKSLPTIPDFPSYNCQKPVNTLRAGVWYIRTSISA